MGRRRRNVRILMDQDGSVRDQGSLSRDVIALVALLSANRRDNVAARLVQCRLQLAIKVRCLSRGLQMHRIEYGALLTSKCALKHHFSRLRQRRSITVPLFGDFLDRFHAFQVQVISL
jgi:hypothetical protein